MTGRAGGRGRARGRARGAQQDEAARPGEQGAPAAAAAPPPSMPPAGSGAPPAASGRASYRGGVKEARPGMGGGDVPQAPVEKMAEMRIGTGDVRDMPRSRMGMRYTEPKTRPAHIADKKGNGGQIIPVKTNHFKLEALKNNFFIYQYRVDFQPEVDNKILRIGLIKGLASLLGETRAFDGTMLFLPFKLPDEETVRAVQKKDGTNTFQITIKLTNELPPNSPHALQVFNIIFKRILGHLDMRQVGRNYYNEALKILIPQHRLEVWPGFVTSIAQYDSGVLLCADVSHKIMRSDYVLDLLYDIYNRSSSSFYDSVVAKLVGSTVLTRYNNNTYRVDDIDLNLNPTSSFKNRAGDDIKYIDYYKNHHNITIKDLTQPLLVSMPKKKDIKMGRKDPIYLIPELCSLTGLSDEVRADFHVMKDVAVHTRIPPQKRVETLTSFVQQMHQNKAANQEMTNWGLKFSPAPLDIDARILPAEQMSQQGMKFTYNPRDADWSKETRGRKLNTPVNIENWVFLVPRKISPQANDLIQTLKRVGPPMGMAIGDPRMTELPDDRNDTYLRALKSEIDRDTQLVTTLLPTNKKDRYDAIKKFCCVDCPVPSQVVVVKTLNKKQMLMSVATKIAIQLNCKLGGDVWCVEIPMQGCMVVGIDSYHDSAKKGRSVGAVVCSTNNQFTRYYSKCAFQHNAQEIMDNIRVCLSAGLKSYHAQNKTLPSRIIIYRDGVGDGQLQTVHEHEVPQVMDLFKSQMGQDYSPKVCFIVVKKRINGRFFASDGRGMVNPQPGTIIDAGITRPEWYDFFLVAQSVRQGTVTPTHFNVIWDTSGLRPDHIQRLSYKMTHLYYNWPGTVRVPAPCQYAHKLAFLVGQSIHKEPSPELADRLFFL